MGQTGWTLITKALFKTFAEDSKLSGAVDTSERLDAIQRDLHKLEK